MGDKAIAEFFVALGVDLDEASVAKADKAVGELGKTLSKGLAVGLAAVSAAALVGVGVIAKWTNDIAGAADQSAKVAQQIGLTTEEVQELTYAAGLAGAEMGDLQTAFRRLGKNAYDAATKGTGPAADAFKALGVSVKDSKGEIRGQMDLFEELVGKIAETESETKKIALANDLFGRGGAKLLPLINAGTAGLAELRAEARALGIVVSAENAAAMEQFNDDLSRLRANWDGFKTQLVSAVMPTLQGLVTRMLDWLAANREVIRERIDTAIRKTGDAVKWLHDRWKDLNAFVRDRIGGWEVVFQAITSALTAGGMISGFFKLRGALMVVLPIAKALLAVGAVALIKIIAIAAVIAFLVFAIDDLITGLQGGESYTKDFLDAFSGTDSVFGKLIDWFKSAMRVGESLWDFLAVALPLAFETWWTIAGPWLEMLWDGIMAIADVLLDALGVSLDDGSGKMETMADWIDGLTAGLKSMQGRIRAWAEVWRGRVEFVVGIVRKLTALLDKIPLGKIAAAASTIGMGVVNPAGLISSAASAGAGAAKSFVFGDTNVSVPVRTGASPEEIAAQTSSAVASVQRRQLALAYARNEGGER